MLKGKNKLDNNNIYIRIFIFYLENKIKYVDFFVIIFIDLRW